MLAVKGDGLLGPEALHDVEGLEKPGQPPAAWNAERIELHVAVAEADPEDEAAAADHVERRNRLGDVDGLLQGQQHDARPEGHLAGFGRHARQHREGLHVLKGRGQVMLAGADVMKARLTRQPHHLQQLGEALAQVIPDGMLHRQRQPEAHSPSPPYS